MIVFGSGDQLEVASENFGLQFENELQVLCHPRISCDVLTADLVDYQ